ncbi:alpha/beta hydrolase [Williamsia deligens]|uniref:Alpha/beta hydrolase n=1 Tax=Williamsia deligens TaxID=321325 RepID=A0ABW3G991_9NOCA|nr:alpha/beta hydrolase [Williamsia deligens]MCP2195794.1 alpha/beta hydrolase fold [Williamsia deligens]
MTSRRRSRLTVVGTAVLVCAALVLSGCSGGRLSRLDSGAASSSEAAPPVSSTVPSPTSGPLARFYTQRIAWGTCAEFAPDADYPPQRSDCGRLTVPVDYDRPDGATASLAVFRLRAAKQSTGILLTNPGGPGVSGVEYMAGTASQFAGMAVGDTLDIIGFDPRGVGRSTPAVRCRSDAQRDEVRAKDWVDTSPAGIAATEARNAAVGAACLQAMGREFLAHLGTSDVIDDIDVLRGALGRQQLNWLGYSYGTYIGARYAERFPTRVRAMINDGAVDPSSNPVADTVAQNAGFQRAFDDFAADCATRRGCPLGSDPARATERYVTLVRSLIGRPAPTGGPRALSYGDAITATGQALYAQTLWQYLRDGLGELLAGRGDVMLRLADLYEGRDRQGRYDTTADAFTAIRCVDGPPIADRATIDRLDNELRRTAPFRDDGRGSGRGAGDECAFWPVPPTSQPHRIDAPGLPTTVVVSTTDDPATPYAAGVSLAQQLRARLVTFRGTQHTAAFEGNACLDGPLTRYLTDLTLPAEGLRC